MRKCRARRERGVLVADFRAIDGGRADVRRVGDQAEYRGAWQGRLNMVDWLLIGTGDIAQKRVAPALASSRNSRLVGVVGSDGARAHALADRHGAMETYAHLDDALTHTRASAVYVATPVYRHAPEATAALA